jgi:hypothetical protein
MMGELRANYQVTTVAHLSHSTSWRHREHTSADQTQLPR